MFPNLLAIHEAEPEMVYDAFEFGFLDVIYHNQEIMKEINLLQDEHLKHEMKKFRMSYQIYVKFYSISPEQDGGKICPLKGKVRLCMTGDSQP